MLHFALFCTVVVVVISIFSWLYQFSTCPYANYVVQKLIVTVDISRVRAFHTKLERYFNAMERTNCGRNIINSLRRRLQETDAAIEQYLRGLSLFD